MRVPLLLLQCVLFLTVEGSQCGVDEMSSQGYGCIKCWQNDPNNPYSVPNATQTGCVDCEAGQITNSDKSKCQCDTGKHFYEGKDGKCVECKKSEVFEAKSKTCRKCPNGSYPKKSMLGESVIFSPSGDCTECNAEKPLARGNGYLGFCTSRLPDGDVASLGLGHPFDSGSFLHFDRVDGHLDTLAESNDRAKCTGVCLGKSSEDSDVEVLRDANGDLNETACKKIKEGDVILDNRVHAALWYPFSWDRKITEIPDWNGERVTDCVRCSKLADASVHFEKADASDGKVWSSQFVNPLDRNECKCDVDEIREKGACKKCEDDEVPNSDGTACISCGEGRKRTIIRDKVLGPNTVGNPNLTVVGEAVCECDASNGAYEENGLCKVCPLDSILDKANGSDGSTVYSCKKCELSMGSFPDSNRERCMECTDPDTEIPSGFLTGMCQVCGEWNDVSLLPKKKDISQFRDNGNGNYRCTSQEAMVPAENKCNKGEYTTHIGGARFENAKASCLPLCAAERHPKAGGVAPASNVYLKDLRLADHDNSFVDSQRFEINDEYLRVRFESEPEFDETHGYGNGNLEHPDCLDCRKVSIPSSFVAGNEIAVDDYLVIGGDELKVLERTGDVIKVKNANGVDRTTVYDEGESIVHVGFRNRQYRYTTSKTAVTTDSPSTKKVWLQTDFDNKEDFALLLGVKKEQSADGSASSYLLPPFENDPTANTLPQWNKPVYIQIDDEIMKVLQTGPQGTPDIISSPGELTNTNSSILVERAQLGTRKEPHTSGSVIYQLPVSASNSLTLGKLEKVELSGQQIFKDDKRVSTFGPGEKLRLHTNERDANDETNPGYKLLNWTATSTPVPYSFMSNLGSGTTQLGLGSGITNRFLDLPEGLQTIHQADNEQDGDSSAGGGFEFHTNAPDSDLKFRFKPTRTGACWVRVMTNEGNKFDTLMENAAAAGVKLEEKLFEDEWVLSNSGNNIPFSDTCLVDERKIYADRWAEIELTGCNIARNKQYAVVVYIDSDTYSKKGSLTTFKVNIPAKYTDGSGYSNVFVKPPRITQKSLTGVEFTFVPHYTKNAHSKIYAAIVEDGPLVAPLTEADIKAEVEKTGKPNGRRVDPFINGEAGASGSDICRINTTTFDNSDDTKGCSAKNVDGGTAELCKFTLTECDLKPNITYRLVTALHEHDGSSATVWGEVITTLGATFSIPENVVFANAPADEDREKLGAKIVIEQVDNIPQMMGFVGNQQNVSEGIVVETTSFNGFHTGATVSLLRLVLPPYQHAFTTNYSVNNPIQLGSSTVSYEYHEFDSVRLQWTASRLASDLSEGETNLTLQFNEHSCPLLPMLESEVGFVHTFPCKERKQEFEKIIVRIGDEFIKVTKYNSEVSDDETDVLEIERGQFGSQITDHSENADVRLYEYFGGIANIGSESLLNYKQASHDLPDEAHGFFFNEDLGYCEKCPPGSITTDNLTCVECMGDTFPNRTKTKCVDCDFKGATRDPDNKDKCKCEHANHGQSEGVAGEENTSDCRECKSYEYVDSKTNECTTCPLGQYPSADKTQCISCAAEEIPTFLFDGCQLCGDGVDPTNRGKCDGCPAKQVLQNSQCVRAKLVGNGVDLWIPVTDEVDYETELGYLQLWKFVEGTGSEAGKAVYKHREDEQILRPVTKEMFSVYSNCGELCSTKNIDLDQEIQLYYKDDDLNKRPVCPCKWAQDLKTNDDILQAPGIDVEDGFSLLSKSEESGEYKNSAPFKDLRNYFATLKRGNCPTEDSCGNSCEIHAHVGVMQDTGVYLNHVDGYPLREIVLHKNGTCNLLGVCKERVPSYTCEDPKRFAEFLSDDTDFAPKLTFLIDHYQTLKSGMDTPTHAQLYHQYLGELSEALDYAFGRRYHERAKSWFPDVTKLADVYNLSEGDLCVDMPFIYKCSDIVMTPEQQLYSEDCEDLTTDKLFNYAGEKRGCAVIQNFGPTNATAEKVREIVLSQLELNVDGDLDAWKDSTGGYPMEKVFDMDSRSKIFDTVDSDGARDLSAVDSTDTEFIKKYQEVWVAFGNKELAFFFEKLVTKAQEGESWEDVRAEAQTAWNSSNLNKTFWINLIYSLQNDADVQNLEVSNVILILAVFFKIYPYEEYQHATCADYFDVNVNSKTCLPGYVEKADFAMLLIQGDDFGAILNQCCDWADDTATEAKPCSDWLTQVNDGVCFDGYEEVVGATCNAGFCKFDECCEHSDASTSSSTSGSPTATTTEVLLDINLGTESSVKKQGSEIVEGPNGATGITDYYLRTEITHKIRISKIMADHCALIGPPERAASATMYNSQIVYDEIQPLQLPIGEGNLSELELNLFGTQIGGKKEIAKVHLQPGCTFKTDDPSHENISEVFAFSMNAHMMFPMEFSSFVADVRAEVDLTPTPVLMKRTYSCSCQPTITSTLVEIKNTFVDILTTYEVLDEPLSTKIDVWCYGLAGLPENTITIITDKSSITELKVVQGKWVKKQIEIKDFSTQMVVRASKHFLKQKFLFYSQTASKGYVENPRKSCKVGGNDQCAFMAMNTFSHADSATEPIKASYQITQPNVQEEVVMKYFHGAFNEQLLGENRFDANGNIEATSGASSFTKFGSFVLTLLF